MSFKERILDIFFPPRCPMCDEVIPSGAVFCDECYKKAYESKKSELGDISIAILNYGPKFRGLAVDMKRYNNSFASEFLGKKLAQEILNKYAKSFFSHIVFVPSTKKHNQAKDIALVVSRELRLPITDSLSCKNTVPQHTLGLVDRPKNAKEKFYKKENIKLKGNILLIDDIITTGSTISVCEGLLREQGADFVQPAAIFKTLYKERYNA